MTHLEIEAAIFAGVVGACAILAVAIGAWIITIGANRNRDDH